MNGTVHRDLVGFKLPSLNSYIYLTCINFPQHLVQTALNRYIRWRSKKIENERSYAEEPTVNTLNPRGNGRRRTVIKEKRFVQLFQVQFQADTTKVQRPNGKYFKNAATFEFSEMLFKTSTICLFI